MFLYLRGLLCAVFLFAFLSNSVLGAQSRSTPGTQAAGKVSPGTISLVQQAGFTNNTTTTVSQSFASGNTAGNLLVALVASIGTGGYDVTPVTDSQGNTWIQAGRTNAYNSIWYVQNCKSGPNTVTITKSDSISRGFLAVAEYSGAAQTGVVLDQTNFGARASSTVAGDTVLLGYPGALVIAMFNGETHDQDWTSPTAGFTIEAGENSSVVAWADNVNSIQGQNPFQVTLGSGTDGWDLKLAAFLPAALPVPTPGYNFIRTAESLNKTLSPGPGSPSQCNFPGGNTAGNLILVICNQFFPSSDEITSVTDTAGNTYTELFSGHDNFVLTDTDVFACNGCIGTNVRNTVSCNFPSANIGDSVDIMAIEYSGQAAGDLLDTSVSSTSMGRSLSYSITPAAAGELLFSVNVTNGGPNIWDDLGIETNRQPSIGNSNNETQMADLLFAAAGPNAITVRRTSNGVAGYTLALKAQPGTVLLPSNFSATVSPNPINELGNFVVSAAIPGAPGSPAPTGTFNITVVGAGSSSYNAETQLGGGPLSLSVSAGQFPVGPVTVSASYSGDAIYAPANMMLSLTLTTPFAVSATPVTLAAPGAVANNTSTVTVSPLGNFTGTVNFSCNLVTTSVPPNAQFLPTCSIPASASITGTAAVASAMTISSTAAHANVLIRHWNFSTRTSPTRPTRLPALNAVPNSTLSWFVAIPLLALLLLVTSGIERQQQLPGNVLRRFCSVLALAPLLVLASTLTSCGGSSNGSTSQSTGTTPGSYVFVVNTTVSGNNATTVFSATTNVTVTIQ